MNGSPLLAVVLVLAPASVLAAPASPMAVEGHVVSAHSRWTSDRSRIVTEATVRTATGDVVVSQLGGTVDGLTMRTFPGPEILEPGMQVAIAAHEGVDLSQRRHVLVDSLRVMAYPPGFVRTGPTKAGNSLYWESGCVFVVPDANGTKHLAGDLEFAEIDRSIAAWNDGVASCSYMKLRQQSRRDTEVGNDNVNAIKFRDVSWCRPASGDDPARCYSPSAAGLTTATYVDDARSARDGAIVDADIEINGVDFAIAVGGASTGTASCRAELSNTLTHELGHLLGLEHPCRTSGDPPRVTGTGQAVPMCSQTTDPLIVEATMYNFQDCGETKKETLASDDIAGVCAVYPIAQDPKSCETVAGSDGCCSASRDAGFPLGAGFASAAIGWVLLRRPLRARRRT